MTQEEKARKYDEALERAKEIIEYYKEHHRFDEASIEDLEHIFPELAESEDERIRKGLIQGFNECLDSSSYPKNAIKYWHGIVIEDILAWLEKQGNQREQLINKACDILVNCIEDYMLRRMEVWSEECKNQTLENIRKKLEE